MNLAELVTPAALADLVRDIASKDSSADFSEVVKAVKETETERIDTALKAFAELRISEAQGRRFVIVYYRNDKLITTHGIEYPEPRDDEGERAERYRVLLDDCGHRFYAHHENMEQLRQNLGYAGIDRFHIAYLDK